MRGGVVIDVGVGKKQRIERLVAECCRALKPEQSNAAHCSPLVAGPVAGIYGIYEHREVLASIPSAEVGPNCGSI